MRKFKLIIPLVLFAACNSTDSASTKTTIAENVKQTDTTEHATPKASKTPIEKHVQASSDENHLTELVFSLPEVMNLEKEITQASKGKRSLVARISSEPSDEQEYYGIAIAEDNGEALATYFQFHIYPGNEIRYYDPIEDAELSLEEWRKLKR